MPEMNGKTDTNSDNNSIQTRIFAEIPWNERNSSHRSSDADSMSQDEVDFNNQINSLRNDLNVTNTNNNSPQFIDSVAVINIDTNGKYNKNQILGKKRLYTKCNSILVK